MAQAHLSPAIHTPAGPIAGALLVENGRIVDLCPLADLPPGTPALDHAPAAILPGLVDSHVHINEPGRTEWEGFRTATQAAAAGGFTTLIDMPLNALPATSSVAALTAKRLAAQGQCTVDWAAWGGLVHDNLADLLPLAQAGVRGFKAFLIHPGCEGFTMVSLAQLEAALPIVAATGLPLLVHAELAGPIEAAARTLQSAALTLQSADWRKYSTYLASRPDEAELQAIAVLIGLCRQYRFRLHIVHLSTALALPLLAQARAEGLPITVETCPHYLHFAAEAVPDGSTLHKCAPPIRSAANRDALWQALAEGLIDLIATDHSPCPPAMKHLDTPADDSPDETAGQNPGSPHPGRFDHAWGGIASLSVALSVLHTEAVARALPNTLALLTRWLSSAPAALAGLSHYAGALLPGREATFTVFDPSVFWQVTPAELHFRHPISPYLGESLQGRVQTTWLRGEKVFDLRTKPCFPVNPTGREVPPG